MFVRAKFKVDKIERQIYGRYDSKTNTSTPVEMQTVVMSPVYSNEEGTENKKFWDASPSRQLTLGCINQAAWQHFELGKEYYIDFTKVEE